MRRVAVFVAEARHQRDREAIRAISARAVPAASFGEKSRGSRSIAIRAGERLAMLKTAGAAC